MTLEEDYLEVFHNLEGGIVAVYEQNPDLLDAQVDTALDHLIRIYNAEAQGKALSKRSVKGAASKVAEALEPLCEVYLGRADVKALANKPVNLEFSIKTAAELTACLKRIKSSVKLWTKKGGRQGYLNFVTPFIEETRNQ